VTVAQTLEARSLVFVDEMGTNTSLSPIYGWAKKGERARCAVPRNRGKNTTVLASMSMEGMGPSLAVEGATTAAVFETYVERVLAPTLRRGQVVVMDNLSAHKGERVRELIEGRGCELLYLPSYSPELNPSRRPSPRWRSSCAKPSRVAAKPFWRRSGRRSRRSAPKTPAGSSSTAATVQWFNSFDHRCRTP
jgi:transposase